MNIVFFHSKEEYANKFHNKIDINDKETLNFSSGSMAFYASFYKYEEKPVMAIEDNGEITSVLFYNITKQKYITILNIVTPVKYRQKGYAKRLIREAVKLAYDSGKTRIRMNCDDLTHTMRFYNKLGLVYWSKTKENSYYVNLPLLSNDIEDFKKYENMKYEEFGINNQSVWNLIIRRTDKTNSEKELLNNKYSNRYMYDLVKSQLGDTDVNIQEK
jgi:hypothetical protein